MNKTHAALKILLCSSIELLANNVVSFFFIKTWKLLCVLMDFSDTYTMAIQIVLYINLVKILQNSENVLRAGPSSVHSRKPIHE